MQKKAVIVKHVENEGPGFIGSLFAAEEWETDIIELSRREALPTYIDEISAVVVMGGPMNVYEEEQYPFLKTEDAFIKTIVGKEIPFLGICLGAQLLAKACGASVKRAAEKEIGWQVVELTEAGQRDRLFRGIPDPVTVFQWHEDTFDLPNHAVLLATGRTCRNQAFRVGHCAYGLQFHIEASGDMVMDWISNEGGIDRTAIQTDTITVSDRLERQTRKVLFNFKRIIDSSSRIRSIMKLFVDEGRRCDRRLWWNTEERSWGHTAIASGNEAG